MEAFLIVAATMIPLWLNIKATLLVARDALSERPQKVVQLLLVWLVPVLGAIVVLGVHRGEEKSPGKYPSERETDYEHIEPKGTLRKASDLVDGD